MEQAWALGRKRGKLMHSEDCPPWLLTVLKRTVTVGLETMCGVDASSHQKVREAFHPHLSKLLVLCVMWTFSLIRKEMAQERVG